MATQQDPPLWLLTGSSTSASLSRALLTVEGPVDVGAGDATTATVVVPCADR